MPDPDIAAQAGVTLVVVGVVLGLNRLVRLVFNGAAGYLYDRFPRRGLMILSMGIGVISTACYAFSDGPALLLAGRVLWGLAWSGIWIGANTMALDISTSQDRGKVNGQLQMWFFIGGGVSSLLGGIFTDWLGYRGGLWACAGLNALAVLVWVFFLPETRQPAPALDPTNLPEEEPATPFPWKKTIPAGIPYMVVRLVFSGVLSATTILWLSQFFESGLRLDGWIVPLASLTGGYSAVRLTVSMVGAPLVGAISDRIGQRWTVMSVVMLIGAGGIWLMSLPSAWLALAGSLLAALASGCVSSLMPSIIGDQVGVERQGPRPGDSLHNGRPGQRCRSIDRPCPAAAAGPGAYLLDLRGYLWRNRDPRGRDGAAFRTRDDL